MESIFKLGILLKVMDMVSGPVQTISKSIDGLAAKAEKLQPVFDRFKDYGRWIAGAGVAGAIGLGVAVTQFSNLEEAQLGLRVLLMDSTGRVGAEYEKLNSLAEQLGSSLPGSTKDMIMMFTALREQGVQTNVILGGMGEAAAKFAVLMKVPFAEGATHVAKFTEALGIADKEAVPFMDTLQRLKGAAGVNVADLSESLKYAGSSLKALRIQGLDAGRDISAAIGLMATSSIEGSQAGTSFAQALTRMAEISSKLDTGKIKKLVGPILDAKGIKLDFFDSGGNFVGIRNMMGELEKLRAINPQEQLLVLSKLFGAEASRPLSVFINQGVAGFDAMLLKMKNQADMQTKIAEIMSGTKMQWETMTGTIANLVAHVGGVVTKMAGLTGILKVVNDLAGKLDAWVLANPKTAGVIVGIVIAVTTLALAVGGLMLAIGFGGTLVTKAIVGYGLFIKTLALLRIGVMACIPAVWSFTVALLANPITWVVIAIAALATTLYLLYQRFEGVRNAVNIALYLFGYLAGVVAKMATGVFGAWLKSMRELAPLFHFLSAAAIMLGGALKWAFLNLTPMGWLIKGFRAAEHYLAGLDWRKSGEHIIMTLTHGIASMAMAPIQAVKAIFQRIRNMLPFSDAKEGPLSQLTLSGARIMDTMGTGILGAAPNLRKTMATALAGAALTANVAAAQPAQQEGRRIIIQQLTVQMNDVTDAKDFVSQLQELVEGYDHE